ncbi:hypothetical protein K450DRAFT_200369 [Umbelopsis ramanniana AG]|uniref:Uncharacterized protein n=1 Tax=Umbelopsis ramanniana AG TaxID=1314678 RepID=A0AAD5HBN9_UMBRA|nr:uncharacterized protein K450DRAFT_200369 [Umbelopsis ramanniana AG]KAI8578340.1 hypothetical protein K450DRAFT_200369 [Umbelopsis ramanniana AG]
MSTVSLYLDDMDLISLCVSYPPLQPYFFSQLKNLAILTHPFCLIEYDIDRCRRLTHLLALSSEENFTAFHRIPKTLRIRQLHLGWSGLPEYSFNIEEGGNIGWIEMFSTIAATCPNINQFVYEAGSPTGAHRPPSSDQTQGCQCDDCAMALIMKSLPPMPNLKKLCLYTDTQPDIQFSIANIISRARIEEFKYISSGHPYVHRELISKIQSTQSLQSLVLLSRSPAATLTLLTVKLCTAFSTIHHLQLDDHSWQSPDRAHALELIATLNLTNLKSFRYEATLYRGVTTNVNRTTNLPGWPGVGLRDVSRILPGETPPPRDAYDLRRYPEYIGYLESNKGIVLTKFFMSFSSLTRVELKNCSFLNDTFFSSIWQCLPFLSELLIQDCPDITGTSIESSCGKGWSQLTKLDISTCKNLTDQCIYAIAETTKASRVQLLVYERPTAFLNPVVNGIIELGYRIGRTHKPSSTILLRGFGNDEAGTE